jgi:type I restriction enzyme S subunit
MSFSDWKPYKLGDIAEVVGGGTPSTTKSDYWGEKYPWLTPRDLSNYTQRFISRGERNITELGLKNSSAKLVPEGTVLLTSRAPIGYLAIASNEVCTNQGFKSFIVDEKKASNEFLFYLLKQNVEVLKQLGTGTTFAEISATTIRNLEFPFPDLKTQVRIAAILSSLDDAIELNQQINKTLEEMAKAIFKEWFVDFNFPNATGKFQETEIGKMPVGWKLGKLNEVLEIKYGKDHKHLESGEIPVYGSGGIMRYADKALYEFESILIPRKGTLSNLFYINKPFWSVDTMFYTKFKLANSGKYLFHLLQSLNLATMNVGSAVPSLTTEVLNNILIAIPTKEVLLKFEEVVSSLFEQIEQNIEENQSLINLRDTLLPKLMKGEININL